MVYEVLSLHSDRMQCQLYKIEQVGDIVNINTAAVELLGIFSI